MKYFSIVVICLTLTQHPHPQIEAICIIEVHITVQTNRPLYKQTFFSLPVIRFESYKTFV
jgi:hypothetical protein